MTEASGYVIELGGEAAGLVVKDGKGFRFYASCKTFASLERTLYRSPAEAEEACRRIASVPGPAIPRLTQQDDRLDKERYMLADGFRHILPVFGTSLTRPYLKNSF
jgi:hypothetical protein